MTGTNKIGIYLRKSRSDEEIERTLGEGETLARHRRTLFEFAKKYNYNIIEVYEEVVSGESILYRPEMLRLLKDVEQGLYNAVLVMDMQRLGRGDLEEQGIILKTFKKSNTKIITPDKIYDLNNEFDEEYSEFEAFMGRKEYKMINKRLQRGIIRSVNDGNYNSPNPPFGYAIQDGKHSRTLTPDPYQSEIVKNIFNWYVYNNIGTKIIADKLNEMGIKTVKGNKWSLNAIAYIIKNPIYIGKITWKKNSYVKSTTPGKKWKTHRNPISNIITADGLHAPIIDEKLFWDAQEILKGNHKPPVKAISKLANPLAGIIICKVCGSKMKYRPYSKVDAHLICVEKCGNKSSKFKYVEKELIESLLSRFKSFAKEVKNQKTDNSNIQVYKINLEILEKELKELTDQNNNLHDLLERKVYDIDTFLSRSKSIALRIEKVKESISKTNGNLAIEIENFNNRVNIIPEIENMLKLYKHTSDAKQQNLILKNLVYKAEYLKVKGQREANFKLELFPKF